MFGANKDEQKMADKLAVNIGIVVTLLIVIVLGFLSIKGTISHNNEKKWPVTVGVVSNLNSYHDGDDDDGDSKYYKYKYTYTVDGTKYEGVVKKASKRPSNEIEVHYNPEDANVSIPESEYGYPTNLYVGLFAATFIMVRLFVQRKK